MNTPLQCEQCPWTGDESETKMPDVRPDEADGIGICPKCGSTELFEVLVEGVNYKMADGILQDVEKAAFKAIGLACLFTFGAAFAAMIIWG